MTKKLSLVEIEYICNMFFQSFEIPVCFLDCNKKYSFRIHIKKVIHIRCIHQK